MPTESIVFAPEINERDLNREVQNVNKQLDDAASDIPTNFDMDGFDIPGGGVGGGMGEMDGGVGGMGATAGAAGLASRLPKPVAGVTAAAAVPIALAGAVGAGMLSAMHASSARLQTSTSLLGQAWDNVWRPIGDQVDQLFVRDIAMDAVRATQDFEETWRSGYEGAAVLGLLQDIDSGISDIIAGEIEFALEMAGLGGGENSIADTVSNMLRRVDWVQAISAGNLGHQLGRIAGDEIVKWVQNDWTVPTFDLPTLTEADIMNTIFGDIFISEADIFEVLGLGGGGTGGGGDGGRGGTGGTGGGGGNDPPFGRREEWERRAGQVGSGGPMVGLQSGGRITRSGVARVHRGELVSDPDRLVNELATAISSAGGGGGDVNLRSLERRLDDVNRNLVRLREAMNVSLSVDGETLGRATANARRNHVVDSDPTV